MPKSITPRPSREMANAIDRIADNLLAQPTRAEMRRWLEDGQRANKEVGENLPVVMGWLEQRHPKEVPRFRRRLEHIYAAVNKRLEQENCGLLHPFGPYRSLPVEGALDERKAIAQVAATSLRTWADEIEAEDVQLAAMVGKQPALAEEKPKPTKKKGKSGRLPATPEQKKDDQRIHREWRSGLYRTYAALAKALGTTPEAIRKAIDRHRHR